jgi:hypothetical protein
VWASMILAHVLHALRIDVALRAEIDACGVSMPLLVERMAQRLWN